MTDVTWHILNPWQVSQLIGVSYSTLVRIRAEDKDFPPHLQLSRRRIGWRDTDIVKWLDRRASVKESE